MHLRSLTSPSPTPPPSTPSLPTSSTINSHAQLATPSDSYPTQSSTESARPPRTPPSTPIPTYQQHQQPVTMWALTASKLERAAQAQMSGSRGAGGLRELVLLSNVWGAARPLWAQEQAEREREQVELERRRKEDEERWLDGVLEEMLEEEEGDEDFVSLTFVEREEVGDSGFLEEEQKVVVQRLRENLDAIEEEEGDSDAEVEAELRPSPRVGEAARDYPLPPSPPLPPRSPPISLPSPNRAHHHHLPFDLDHAFAESDLSSSPPLHLPALTPDSTPPGPGLASDLALLGTSADSVDSNLDDSYQWVQDRSTAQRLGLLALDLSTPSQKRGDPPSSLSLDMISLSRQHPHGLLPSESDSIPLYHHPERPPSTSLALTLTAKQQYDAQNWTPRPPRSLSLPSLRAKAAGSSPATAAAEPILFPSFSGGIVKSFYDCVDFGRPPSPEPSTTPSAGSTGDVFPPPRGRDSSSSSHLALVLARPRPLPPFLWRERSLSPAEDESTSRGRTRLVDE